MKIRLDQVVKPFDWQETLQITDAELDRSAVVELGEIECRGRIVPLVEDFLLRARLAYDQKLRCMRCLGPVAASVSTDIELLLHLGGPQETGVERELEEEELGMISVENSEFDTRPILLEQVHLSVPMKPLCRDDCAGFCPSCGADKNRGPCDCGKVADPRWEALASLRARRPDRTENR